MKTIQDKRIDSVEKSRNSVYCYICRSPRVSSDVRLIHDKSVCFCCWNFYKVTGIETFLLLFPELKVTETQKDNRLAQSKPSTTSDELTKNSKCHKQSKDRTTNSGDDLMEFESRVNTTKQLSKKEQYQSTTEQILVNSIIPQMQENASLHPVFKKNLRSYLELHLDIRRETAVSIQTDITKNEARLSYAEAVIEDHVEEKNNTSNLFGLQNEKRQNHSPDEEFTNARHSTPKLNTNPASLQLQQNVGHRSFNIPSPIPLLKSHDKKSRKRSHSLPYEIIHRNENMSSAGRAQLTNDTIRIPLNNTRTCKKKLDFSNSPNISHMFQTANIFHGSSSAPVTPKKPVNQYKPNSSADQIITRKGTYSPLEIKRRHGKSMSPYPIFKPNLSHPFIECISKEHRKLPRSSSRNDSSSKTKHSCITSDKSFNVISKSLDPDKSRPSKNKTFSNKFSNNSLTDSTISELNSITSEIKDLIKDIFYQNSLSPTNSEILELLASPTPASLSAVEQNAASSLSFQNSSGTKSDYFLQQSLHEKNDPTPVSLSAIEQIVLSSLASQNSSGTKSDCDLQQSLHKQNDQTPASLSTDERNTTSSSSQNSSECESDFDLQNFSPDRSGHTILLSKSYHKGHFDIPSVEATATFRCVEFNRTNANINCNKCQQHMNKFYVECSSVAEHIFCFPCVGKYIKENDKNSFFCPSGDKCPLRDSEIPWVMHESDVSYILHHASLN